jgi:hypothetical protein
MVAVTQGRFWLDDLDPDGLVIKVEWDKFIVGSSIFVPAINHVKLKEQILDIAKRKRWEVETRRRVESKILGVRIWRKL